jgi:uncharacterized protein YndB with AHSA1/START domain
MSKRKHETRVELLADPETVWKEVATAEGLKHWFALDARDDPDALWISWGPGMEGAFAKVASADPPRRLVWADSRGGDLLTEFIIEGEGGGGKTTLRIVASGFDDGEQWDNEFEGTRRGWRVFGSLLKHAVERHPGQPRLAMMVMRQPKLAPEQIWEQIRAGLGDPGPVAESTPGETMSFVLPDLDDGFLAIEVGPGGSSCSLSATVCAYGPHASRDAVTAWLARVARILPV